MKRAYPRDDLSRPSRATYGSKKRRPAVAPVAWCMLRASPGRSKRLLDEPDVPQGPGRDIKNERVPTVGRRRGGMLHRSGLQSRNRGAAGCRAPAGGHHVRFQLGRRRRFLQVGKQRQFTIWHIRGQQPIRWASHVRVISLRFWKFILVRRVQRHELRSFHKQPGVILWPEFVSGPISVLALWI